MVLDEDMEVAFLLVINNSHNAIVYVWLEPILFKNEIQARDTAICVALHVYAFHDCSSGGRSVQAAVQLGSAILMSSFSGVCTPLSDA